MLAEGYIFQQATPKIENKVYIRNEFKEFVNNIYMYMYKTTNLP